MVEYVDIVDENDNVIGKTTRKEVHQKQLLHRIVHVVILNSKGEILIHQRAGNLDTYPNLWTSSASGHVESGSSYMDTAKKELKEELGIQTGLKELGKVLSLNPEHMQMITIFTGLHEGPFKFDKNEVQRIEFAGIQKLKEEIRSGKKNVSPAFSEVFKKLCKEKSL